MCQSLWNNSNLPTTMTLKLNPLRTLLRCHWLGRFAKPTYPVNFLLTMFRMSLACWAASFGSLELTLCGTSCVGDTALPFGMGAGVLVGATEGETPFAAVKKVSSMCQMPCYSNFVCKFQNHQSNWDSWGWDSKKLWRSPTTLHAKPSYECFGHSVPYSASCKSEANKKCCLHIVSFVVKA